MEKLTPMPKIRNVPRIKLYFHCRNCMSGKLAVGLTDEGIQVFCEDCKKNVYDIHFRGQKVEII